MLRNAPKSSWNCIQCLSAKKAPYASALADSQGQHPWLWELSVLFRPSAPIPVPCCTFLCLDVELHLWGEVDKCVKLQTEISMNGRQMQTPLVQRGHEVQALAAALLADISLLSLVTISLMFGLFCHHIWAALGMGNILDSWANDTACAHVCEVCSSCCQPLISPQPREIQRGRMGFRQTREHNKEMRRVEKILG